MISTDLELNALCLTSPQDFIHILHLLVCIVQVVSHQSDEDVEGKEPVKDVDQSMLPDLRSQRCIGFKLLVAFFDLARDFDVALEEVASIEDKQVTDQRVLEVVDLK